MKENTVMLHRAICAYGAVRERYAAAYALLADLRDEMRKGKYSQRDMVNFLYVMREMSRVADDLRKEADGIIKMFENLTCALYLREHIDDAPPIRASLAVGTPNIRLGVKIPNKDREPGEFYALMKHFGVPRETIDANVVKVHWPGICDVVSQRAENGEPLPPGISPDKTYPTYSVAVRAARNIDEVYSTIKNKAPSQCDTALE